MKLKRRLNRDQQGVATVEMAFALPVLIVIIFMFVQLAQVYRAMSGIQQALGQGARYATLCINPSLNGCAVPTADQIKTVINNSVTGFNNFLTIDKGLADGVRPRMGVLAPDGMVGIVRVVTKNYSLVLSVLNQQSKISVALKKTGHFGSLIW